MSQSLEWIPLWWGEMLEEFLLRMLSSMTLDHMLTSADA